MLASAGVPLRGSSGSRQRVREAAEGGPWCAGRGGAHPGMRGSPCRHLRQPEPASDGPGQPPRRRGRRPHRHPHPGRHCSRRPGPGHGCPRVQGVLEPHTPHGTDRPTGSPLPAPLPHGRHPPGRILRLRHLGHQQAAGLLPGPQPGSRSSSNSTNRPQPIGFPCRPKCWTAGHQGSRPDHDDPPSPHPLCVRFKPPHRCRSRWPDLPVRWRSPARLRGLSSYPYGGKPPPRRPPSLPP